ncbi:MAG TPA: hypothetical protein DD706_01245 [Nitrospiraceae bacterium]|nr:hypothetical protein [Nitrospiraceae bacterium]
MYDYENPFFSNFPCGNLRFSDIIENSQNRAGSVSWHQKGRPRWHSSETVKDGQGRDFKPSGLQR